MKNIVNKIKGFLMDKRVEKKERTLAEKRAALEEIYSYAVPTLTVAAMTATALAGNFSF